MRAFVPPFQGLVLFPRSTQGVALGCRLCGPLALSAGANWSLPRNPFVFFHRRLLDLSRAGIIRLRDDAACAGWGGGEHGAHDGLGVFEGEAANGGAAAAEETAEGACAFTGGDDFGEERDEGFFAVGLVEVILECTFEHFVISRGEGGGNSAGIRATARGSEAGDGVGEGAPCVGRGDFKIGDEEDEVQVGIDCKTRDLFSTGDGETSEGGGGGVVGVAFEFGADLEKRGAVERGSGEFIEAGEEAEADGDAAAHAATAGDFAFDFPGKRKRLGFCLLEKHFGGGGGHRVKCGAAFAGDGDLVKDAQRHAEGVVAGA